jgi:hypothetical protein
MPVFNANPLTPRTVPDPGTDHMLPDGGSLSYGGITGQSALASTNGVDALLVNGNRDRQMNGNESTRITQNRSHTVGGNQQKKVAGNKTENVVGNFMQTTIGNLHRSVIGATNDLYTAEHTVEHKANQVLQEAAGYYHTIKAFAEKHESHIDDYMEYQLHALLVQNFIVHNLDVKGIQNAAIGLLAEVHGIDNKAKEIDNDIKELQNKVHALDNRVGAIQPVVHITMLHEVAITQKILIVGVNQFM